MSRRFCTYVSLLLVLLTSVTGCHPTQPFYLHEDGDFSHFVAMATDVELPDVEGEIFPAASSSMAPLTLSNPEFERIWDLTLEEAISIAMQNNKVIRNLGSVTQFTIADGLISRTGQATTVFDTAITETQASPQGHQVNPSNGSRVRNNAVVTANTVPGIEDALSEFDAQFFATASTGNTDRPRNVPATGNPFQPQLFAATNGNFLAALSKRTVPGGVWSIRNRTTYNRNNIPIGIGRALGSDWTAEFEVEWEQPLMRGRGTQVNRVPILLARINSDISIAQFEIAVRNELLELENTYWDLHSAYRNLETAKVARDAAQALWKNVYLKKEGGVSNARDEAQAREQYFFFRAQAETAFRDLLNNETRLRWLMGIESSDKSLIRPVDEPVLADVEFDWNVIVEESLQRSAELRQKRWQVKQRELELISARNQLLPELNVSLLYRWVGVGDDLMNADRNGLNFATPGSTAFDELTEGNFQEAFVSLDFRPSAFGARRQIANVRTAQLGLAREKARLEEMELNLTNLLATSVNNLDSNYAIARTQANRIIAAQKEVESAEALEEVGSGTVDDVLEAQRRRAQAQFDFFRALSEYAKSIADVHFRKGSLLEFDNVYLAEGPWPKKAYWDAAGRARERDASYFFDYGWTRPGVVSRGAVQQHQHEGRELLPGDTEQVPTPAPDVDREPAGEPDTFDPRSRRQARHSRGTPSPQPPAVSPSGVVPASHESFEWGSLQLDAPSSPSPALENPLRPSH